MEFDKHKYIIHHTQQATGHTNNIPMEFTQHFSFSALPLLILFILPLFIFISISRRRRRRTSNSRNLQFPPSPPQLPVIGNFHNLIQIPGLPHQIFFKLAQKYGPIYRLKLGSFNMVVVSSRDVLKDIVLHHDQTFSDRPKFNSGRVITYNYSNLSTSSYGNYWRQMRKTLMVEFLSAKRVRSFQAIREEETDRLVDEIRADSGISGSGVINLSKKVYSLTNGIVCRAALGRDRGANERILELLREVIVLFGEFSVGEFFPCLWFLSDTIGTGRKLQKIHVELDGLFDEILKEHRVKEEDQGGAVMVEEDEDLVDALLRVQQEYEGEETLTDATIKGLIFDIFSAGTDTSATTIVWAMSELMKNPEAMARAQSEVRSIIGSKPEKIDENELHKLKYLKLVVKETLRLHPPAPLLIPREAMESCVVAGYDIPAGWRLLVNCWAISRDKEYWSDDAESFKPERFEESEVDFKGQHFEFTPFGWGRRGCPGMSFALPVVEDALAHLLASFDWKTPNGEKCEDFDMEEGPGLIATRKHDLNLIAALPLI